MQTKRLVVIGLLFGAIVAATAARAEPRCYKNPSFGSEYRGWLLRGGPLSGDSAPKPVYCES